MARTNFCIIGFPKCGTTAMVRFIKASPECRLWKHHKNGWESPFYKLEGALDHLGHEPGLINGHKFSGYIYSPKAIVAAYEENPDTLFILNVRPALPVLMSWMKMHRGFAERQDLVHMVTASEESRRFYLNCTPDEYFEAYANTRLNYADAINRLTARLPDARLLVVSQARLATDARGVMSRFHELFGREAPAGYLEDLPAAHVSVGERAAKGSPVSEAVAAELAGKDRKLKALIDALPEERKLVIDGDSF